MSENTETSPDEAVAAELAVLLPRLPRVKITPQTISQTIIDRWYGHETEYRQTIAGLRAELAERHAADNENIGIETRPLTKRELRDIGMAVVGPLKYLPERWDHETVARLYWALMQQRGEAIMARRELAELRERIGQESVQWGVRYTTGVDGTGADCTEEEDPIDYCDNQADANQLAAQTPGAIPVWHLRGEWKAVADDA